MKILPYFLKTVDGHHIGNSCYPCSMSIKIPKYYSNLFSSTFIDFPVHCTEYKLVWSAICLINSSSKNCLKYMYGDISVRGGSGKALPWKLPSTTSGSLLRQRKFSLIFLLEFSFVHSLFLDILISLASLKSADSLLSDHSLLLNVHLKCYHLDFLVDLVNPFLHVLEPVN